MSPLDRHIKIRQKRYTIEMANRNVDTDVWSTRNIDDEVEAGMPRFH
jgi:hypothetical protein